MPSSIEHLSLWRAFTAMVRRDLLIKWRKRGDWVHPIAFFILVVTLFPLGLSPEPHMLRALAPGLIWVAALLAVLLSFDGLFRQDFQDGTLEQWLMSPYPEAWLVFAKMSVHWLTTGLPLALISPWLGAMLGLPFSFGGLLMVSLVLGTMCLSGLGAIGAALVVGLQQGGVLLSLLMLPLYVPVLILGTGTLRVAMMEAAYTPPLALLGALCVVTLGCAPLVTGYALRLSANGR